MKPLSYLLLIILVICADIAGALAESCTLASHNNLQGTVVTLEGHYANSFEFSGFKSCRATSNDWWWLSASKHYATLYGELEKHGKKDYHAIAKLRLFVKIKACLSPPGHYGHMGAFPRLIEVLDVYEHRLGSDADCDTNEGAP